nr:hypothetical protein [Novosphingobium aquimarinum]
MPLAAIAKGKKWTTFTPPAAALRRRYRGLILHRRSHRAELVTELMSARRAVGAAKRGEDDAALRKARTRVDQAKRALGERGPVWWTDGAPDYNRHLARNTPYAMWYERLEV